jgi:hypothetical protein
MIMYFIYDKPGHELCNRKKHWLRVIKISVNTSIDYTLILAKSPRSRGNSVSIVTGYGLADRGGRVRAPVGARIFSMSSTPVLGPTQPPIQWVSGALSPGVKRPERGADHSPPTSAEVKKMWICISTPPYVFMV